MKSYALYCGHCGKLLELSANEFDRDAQIDLFGTFHIPHLEAGENIETIEIETHVERMN